MPTVSVIMSVYNAQKDLERSVRSLLENTYTDFELLLVDDGSTDGTAAVMQRLAKEDSRIRLFTMPQNGGQAAARNFGMAQAKGEFIAFADADDWVEPAYLEVLTSAMDAKCDVAVCGFYMDIPGKGSCKTVAPPHMRLAQKVHVLEYFLYLKDTFLLDAAWNKLYRAEFLRQNGLQMPSGQIFEDTEFALQVLQHTNQICLVEEPLYHYVQQSGSTTRKFQPQKLEFLKQRYRSMLDYFGEDITPALRGYADQFLITAYFSYFADLFLPDAKLRKKQIRQTIKECTAQPEYLEALQNARSRTRTQKRTLRVAGKSLGAKYRYAKSVYFLKYKCQKLFLRLK